MNILIVDGNEKEASDRYLKIGMLTQFQLYKDVLQGLLKKNCNIITIHPAYQDSYLPQGIALGDFHGIVWTGSLLNIYDMGSPIERQIELAKQLFNKKNKIFGSCWGLQVLTTAAGGKIRKNPNGLEAVIANNITLNDNGINHPMYFNKSKKFDSFCWHYDEVESLPEGALILSSNEKSTVQSLSFLRGKSEVWGVQYHPEFYSSWISGLMKQRKSLLLEEEVYESEEYLNKLCLYLSDIEKNKNLKKILSISETLISKKFHNLELFNWLKNLTDNN